jgi:prophage DNA circulation protein
MAFGDWRDKLRPASYRGVPFVVESSELQSGRRLVLHKFPNRDKPEPEDFGRELREWTLEAFVLGDDYLERRDRLLEACESRNTTGAVLIHPTFGHRLVVARRVRVRETTDELRMARLTIEFVEIDAVKLGPKSGPKTSDPGASTEKAAVAVDGAAEADFARVVKVEDAPEEDRTSIATELEAISRKLRGLSFARAEREALAEFVRSADRLATDAASLALEPADLVIAVVEAVRSLRAAASDAVGALHAYEILLDLEPLALPGDGVGPYGNAVATVELFRRAVASEAARTISGIRWSHYEQAIAERARLLERFDSIEASATSELYALLVKLRRAVLTAVPPPGETLPRLATVTLPATTPALRLAFELYEDPTRAGEIQRRNSVRNASFLPGGVPIEVLSGGA